MTWCNYCHYRSIVRKAGENVVTKQFGWRGGIDVFVHPPEIEIERGAGEEGHPQNIYFKAWLMELPNSCAC